MLQNVYKILLCLCVQNYQETIFFFLHTSSHPDKSEKERAVNAKVNPRLHIIYVHMYQV